MLNIRIAQTIALITFLAGMATTSIAAPKVVVVQATGGIRIDNPTSFAFDIYLDNALITSLGSGSSVRLKSVPVGRRAISTRSIGKANIPGQEFSMLVKPNRTRSIELRVPEATLTVFNPNPFVTRLKVPGFATRILAPKATATFAGLEPGNTTIRLEAKSHLRKKATVFLAPGQQTNWTPNPWTGKVDIFNPGATTIRVRIDGEFVGHVPPKTSREFQGITPGFTQISMTPKGMNKKVVRNVYINPGHPKSVKAPIFKSFTKVKVKKGKKPTVITKYKKKKGKKIIIAQW